MPDDLVKINIQVAVCDLPAWCPACGTRTVDKGAWALPVEDERAAGWNFWVVGCTQRCGILAKPIANRHAYELYAPKSLIPKLVARKLRGELNSNSGAHITEIATLTKKQILELHKAVSLSPKLLGLP